MTLRGKNIQKYEYTILTKDGPCTLFLSNKFPVSKSYVLVDQNLQLASWTDDRTMLFCREELPKNWGK